MNSTRPQQGDDPVEGPRRSKRIRCLLLSPVAPPDPDNGDAQYTRELMAAPPDGVDYVTYIQAIEDGELVRTPALRASLGAIRSLPDLVVFCARLLLVGLRRSKVLLPDHVSWLRVTGQFDLVHDHCIPVRFVGPHPPLVLSDSAGMWWHWVHSKGLAEERVRRLLRRERRVAKMLGYAHATVHPEPAVHTTFFVKAGQRHLEQFAPRYSSTSISPVGVPRALHPEPHAGHTVLFVARDFVLKGGREAIEIVRRLRQWDPTIRLVLAGSARPTGDLPDWIEWFEIVDRATLYRDIYPMADLFLYPTKFDCAPLVVVEALAHGLPIIAPRAFGLPELIQDSHTGLLFEPGNIEDAGRAISTILSDPTLHKGMSANCLADFEARFSVERRNDMLEQIYRASVK